MHTLWVQLNSGNVIKSFVTPLLIVAGASLATPILIRKNQAGENYAEAEDAQALDDGHRNLRSMSITLTKIAKMKFQILDLLKALFISSTCLGSLPVSAQDWKLVSETDIVKSYIDVTSIKTINGYIRAWSLQNRNKPTKSGEYSFKALEEYDCKLDRTRIISLIAYKGQMGSGDGTTSNGIGEWEYPAPGTNGGTILKFVCSR